MPVAAVARIRRRDSVRAAHRVRLAAFPRKRVRVPPACEGAYPQPHDFTVGWSAAHKHFLRWCRSGVWAKVLTAIRGEVLTRSGRRRRPSAAVVDSSSVKAPPVAGPRGFDGAKKVDGIKRHILVDSVGMLVAALATPADMQDRAAFPAQLRQANKIAPTISHAWLVKGYTGPTVAAAATRAGVSVEVVSGPKPGHGSSSNPAAGSSNAPPADQPLPPP